MFKPSHIKILLCSALRILRMEMVRRLKYPIGSRLNRKIKQKIHWWMVIYPKLDRL